MSTQQNVPGDVIIKTVSIFTDRGVVNIVEHVKAISIFESIFTPGIMAELTIWDTKNIASELPILAGQKIVIELLTPGRKMVKYELIASKIGNGLPADNSRTKTYVLMAVSPEVVRAKANMVVKAYNTNISSIVSDIIKSYLGTKKKLNIQQTKGIQKIIIPSEQPLEAVSMLRKRSISIDNKSSAFVFFENQEGFHFRTIEDLMKGSVGDRVFLNDETIRTDMTKPIFRNIIAIEEPDQFDAVTRVGEGGLSFDTLKFDFKTLEYSRKNTKFKPSDYKNPDGTMKNPDAKEMDQFSKSPAIDRWVMHDSSNPDTFIADNLGNRVSATSIFGQSSILLEVFGDSELTAGQVIEVKSVENDTSTKAPREHKMLSGKYLVAFLHHVIGMEGDNPRYTCSIEAIKGGYKEAV